MRKNTPSYAFSTFIVLEDGAAPRTYQCAWVNDNQYQDISAIGFKPLEVTVEDMFLINRYTRLTVEVGDQRVVVGPLCSIIDRPLVCPVEVQPVERVKLFVECERAVSKPVVVSVCLYSTRLPGDF